MTDYEMLEYWREQNAKECEDASLSDMCAWFEWN